MGCIKECIQAKGMWVHACLPIKEGMQTQEEQKTEQVGQQDAQQVARPVVCT